MSKVGYSTVSSEQYERFKKAFFSKHKHDFTCDTSSMDSYGTWYKTYSFADGATWWERMGSSIEKGTVSVRGIDFPINVKMLRVEFWNTDDAFSKVYYEVFNHNILLNNSNFTI